MSKPLTENMVAEDAWTKNGEQKGSKMEVFLISVSVLPLGTCMFRELATNYKERGMIRGILGDE